MTSLDGRLVATSVSDAPDRARLGFPQREIDRALLSTCTALVRAGAEIGYAGNLDSDGYTYKIFRHLAGAYAGSRDTPFRHFIPEPVARITRFEDLRAILDDGRGVVRTSVARGDIFVAARPVGNGIRLGEDLVSDDTQLATWFAYSADRLPTEGFRAARQMISQRADARVIMGGKMGIISQPADSYAGAMPGIVEEAIGTLEASKPLVILAAFGGAARDVAIALGLMDAGLRVPRGEQHPTYLPSILRIAGLSDRIPADQRNLLATIANDDRAEQNGFQIAAVIAKWLSLSGTKK